MTEPTHCTRCGRSAYLWDMNACDYCAANVKEFEMVGDVQRGQMWAGPACIDRFKRDTQVNVLLAWQRRDRGMMNVRLPEYRTEAERAYKEEQCREKLRKLAELERRTALMNVYAQHGMPYDRAALQNIADGAMPLRGDGTGALLI